MFYVEKGRPAAELVAAIWLTYNRKYKKVFPVKVTDQISYSRPGVKEGWVLFSMYHSHSLCVVLCECCLYSCVCDCDCDCDGVCECVCFNGCMCVSIVILHYQSVEIVSRSVICFVVCMCMCMYVPLCVCIC